MNILQANQYCYENRNNVLSFNTRQQIHTNKYIELVPSKSTTSMREKVIDKCANKNVYIIHSQKCVHCIQKAMDYKRARQRRRVVVRIQSTLCGENNHYFYDRRSLKFLKVSFF